MPYLLLIHEPIGQRQAAAGPKAKRFYQRMLRFAGELKQRGVLRAVESLTSQDEAVRVKVGKAGRKSSDGPFAEAKEMVGGFFLLDCASRDEAIAIARECPAAEWATVEVRATGPCYT